MKVKLWFIVFMLCGISTAFTQSDREITARNKFLVEWGKDGVMPLTAPSTDGTQNLAVLAAGWYFPLAYTAKAGVPSILRIYTHNTYDCSRSLVIPELKVRKTLPASGVVAISIPAKKKGEVLFGTCSMGMYTFTIKFE